MVCLEQLSQPAWLRRGMPILVPTGEEIGVVAAVVLDSGNQQVTHLLLGHVPPTSVYRLVPLSLIDHVSEHSVWLQVAGEDVAHLPAYRSSQ